MQCVNTLGSDRDMLAHLRQNALDHLKIDVEVPVKEEERSLTPGSLILLPKQSDGSGKPKVEKKSLPISEARKVLEEAEMELLVSAQDLKQAAIKAVEQDGIVFIDEIDKICTYVMGDRI
jgi:ATP-dependent HslUV protease ATP-binding subunit HslU